MAKQQPGNETQRSIFRLSTSAVFVSSQKDQGSSKNACALNRWVPRTVHCVNELAQRDNWSENVR